MWVKEGNVAVSAPQVTPSEPSGSYIKVNQYVGEVMTIVSLHQKWLSCTNLSNKAK